MTPKEILIKAKSLIPDEQHWSTGNDNAIKRGAQPAGFGRNGVYCAHGAISVAAGGSPEKVAPVDTPEGKKALSLLAEAIKPGSLSDDYVVEDFNDHLATLAELHDAFDRAIAAAD